MRVSRTIYPGQHLFRAGDTLQAIYAVRSGSFKTMRIDCDGYEHVVGFHLPSELIGLDAIYAGVHPGNAIALSAGTVCIFPYDALVRMAAEAGTLTERLLRLFSRQMAGNPMAAGDYTAEESLAAFMLMLSQRMHPRGEAATRLLLPMSRADIANHLRLAGATLSRCLARLQARGLIRLEQRVLYLDDVNGLRQLARRVPAMPP